MKVFHFILMVLAFSVVGIAVIVAVPAVEPVVKVEEVKQDVDLQKLYDKIAKTHEEIDAIYELISAGNSTKFAIMDTERRIFHYIAGHDIRKHFENGCPECGLIEQLSVRKKELYDEITALNDYVVEHPDDPNNAEKNKKINELTIEENYVTRYIMGSQDRAKELGKLMYAKIRDAEKAEQPKVNPVLGDPVPVE